MKLKGIELKYENLRARGDESFRNDLLTKFFAQVYMEKVGLCFTLQEQAETLFSVRTVNEMQRSLKNFRKGEANSLEFYLLRWQAPRHRDFKYR